MSKTDKYVVKSPVYVNDSGVGTISIGVIIERTPDGIDIDGRLIAETAWFDKLIAMSERKPHAPVLVPYSAGIAEKLRNRPLPESVAKRKKPVKNSMKVVKSDEDLTEPIDIRSTQVGKNKQSEKEASREAKKSKDLPIIRGDESVEERLEALKGKTDIASIEERANLKAKLKMPIVYDDSLGASVPAGTVALNAGKLKNKPTSEYRGTPKTGAAVASKGAKTASSKSSSDSGTSKSSVKKASPKGSKPGPKPGSKRRSLDERIAEARRKLEKLEAEKGEK